MSGQPSALQAGPEGLFHDDGLGRDRLFLAHDVIEEGELEGLLLRGVGALFGRRSYVRTRLRRINNAEEFLRRNRRNTDYDDEPEHDRKEPARPNPGFRIWRINPPTGRVDGKFEIRNSKWVGRGIPNFSILTPKPFC